MKECPKCYGLGWVWWDQLEEYIVNSILNPENEKYEDLKHTCDLCHGTGIIKD